MLVIRQKFYIYIANSDICREQILNLSQETDPKFPTLNPCLHFINLKKNNGVKSVQVVFIKW